MHVAWGWAHGLAQYRDVFDNHMPLFHLLSSPLFAATGDDPRLLFAARLSMIPLFLAALFLVWRIARSLFDETTAWWATALAAAATALVPLLVAAGFAMAGLWRPFVYGVFQHNGTPFEHAWHVLWFIPFYFFIRAVALRMARSDAEPALVRRRLFAFLACG